MKERERERKEEKKKESSIIWLCEWFIEIMAQPQNGILCSY